MKTNWTAQLTDYPDSRTESDTSVAGGYIPTHKQLAEHAAKGAAENYAEPEAEGWTYDTEVKSWVAIMPDGTQKPYEIVAFLAGASKFTEAEQATWGDDDERWDKDGDEWDTEFNGTVIINGAEFPVFVN